MSFQRDPSINYLKFLIDSVGGVVKVAKACGVTRYCVYNWCLRGGLPRTEYSGETNYAEKIAALSDSEKITKEVILKYCRAEPHMKAYAVQQKKERKEKRMQTIQPKSPSNEEIENK